MSKPTELPDLDRLLSRAEMIAKWLETATMRQSAADVQALIDLARRAQPQGEAPQAVAIVGNADFERGYQAALKWCDENWDKPAATLSPLCCAQHAESGKERGSIEDYNEFNRLLGNWGQSSWGGSADEIDSTKAYGDLVEYIDAWSYRHAAQLDGGQEGGESNG